MRTISLYSFTYESIETSITSQCKSMEAINLYSFMYESAEPVIAPVQIHGTIIWYSFRYKSIQPVITPSAIQCNQPTCILLGKRVLNQSLTPMEINENNQLLFSYVREY